MDDKNQILQ